MPGGYFAWRYIASEREEQLHFQKNETKLIVSNLAHVPVELLQAGKNLEGAKPVSGFDGESAWLGQGNYFLKSTISKRDSSLSRTDHRVSEWT